MKVLHVGMLIGALALVGCDRESNSGGPGAKQTTTTTTRDGTVTTTKTENRDETFKVQVPSGGTNITQGKREEVSISLSRGSDFKQDVKLTFESPKGLKVIPATTTIKSGDDKTKVFVEVAEDATVGRHSITVTGAPATGKSASVMMDIDVKKRD